MLEEESCLKKKSRVFEEESRFLYFLFEVMANFSDKFFQRALQTDEMSTNWR